LGESDEKPFRPADVAEPIRVFILHYFAYELRAALFQASRRCRPRRTWRGGSRERHHISAGERTRPV